jgi:hypothetical protein
MYVAKIGIYDLDAMVSFLDTAEGKEFVWSWSVYRGKPFHNNMLR